MFAVCGEDSDVCIPDALGGRVLCYVGAVIGVDCVSGGPDVLCGAGWEESDLSEIELGGAGFTVGAPCWYSSISTTIESCLWEVSDVTVVLGARCAEQQTIGCVGHCYFILSKGVLAWGVPVGWL